MMEARTMWCPQTDSPGTRAPNNTVSLAFTRAYTVLAKWWDIWSQLILITNKKLHSAFWLMTLYDLEVLLHAICRNLIFLQRQLCHTDHSKTHIFSSKNIALGIYTFGWYIVYGGHLWGFTRQMALSQYGSVQTVMRCALGSSAVCNSVQST